MKAKVFLNVGFVMAVISEVVVCISFMLSQYNINVFQFKPVDIFSIGILLFIVSFGFIGYYGSKF